MDRVPSMQGPIGSWAEIALYVRSGFRIILEVEDVGRGGIGRGTSGSLAVDPDVDGSRTGNETRTGRRDPRTAVKRGSILQARRLNYGRTLLGNFK